jgi:hypothetical protein
MAEEVNSKALAAGSTANRLGIPSQNRLEDVDIRPDAGTTADPHPRAAGSGDAAFANAAGLRGPLIEVSGYDLPNGVPRDAPGNSDK